MIKRALPNSEAQEQPLHSGLNMKVLIIQQVKPVRLLAFLGLMLGLTSKIYKYIIIMCKSMTKRFSIKEMDGISYH